VIPLVLSAVHALHVGGFPDINYAFYLIPTAWFTHGAMIEISSCDLYLILILDRQTMSDASGGPAQKNALNNSSILQ